MKRSRRQERRGTKAYLENLNEVLLDGELCYERQSDGTYKLKVGNGNDHYVDLPYTIPFGTRVLPLVSSPAPVANCDLYDVLDISALAVSTTIAAPTGTPRNGQKLMYRIRDDGTPRSLAWNAAFVNGGVALPVITVAGRTLKVGVMYNTANNLNKWECIAAL